MALNGDVNTEKHRAMIKCPYCYEILPSEENLRCPHCLQFIIDSVIRTDFPSLDKKHCLFCGKKILLEAKICRHCKRWLDEIEQAAKDIDPEDLV